MTDRKHGKGFRILSVLGGIAALIALMLYMAGMFTPNQIGPGKIPGTAQGPGPRHTVQAVRETVPEFYEAVGTVRPRQETRVESQVQGRIVKVMVRAGDVVKEGDRLVVLDSREFQARLDRARQALLSAKARKSQAEQAVNAARAAFHRAESAYKRVRTYFKAEAATQQQLEEAEAAFRQAKAGLQQAEEGLREGNAGVKQAEKVVEESGIALGYKEIDAPAAGEVAKRLVEPGDMAFPGKPLVILQTRGALRLEALLPESLIKRVAVGDSLRVSIDALGQTVSGKLAELVPAADPVTRSFLVKVDIPSIKGLYPGMFGRLMVPVGTASVIWLPRHAVREVGQLEMVAAKIGDQWKTIYVTTGRTEGNRVEILSGLNGDETVAVTEKTE